jgi:hypothetical protein
MNALNYNPPLKPTSTHPKQPNHAQNTSQESTKMPIAHVGVNVQDAKASTAFYLAALAPFGYSIFKDIDHTVVGMAPKYGAPDFWIHQCPEHKTAGAMAKTHVAFCASSRKVVDEFHKAALYVRRYPGCCCFTYTHMCMLTSIPYL